MGVIVVADESGHTVEDSAVRVEQGYKAIELKAIARTLSMTLKFAQYAFENNVPCFCADLTVNPILVDWNKSVAARLLPLPRLSLGVLETNGHRYYKNWQRMMLYYPCDTAEWQIKM